MKELQSGELINATCQISFENLKKIWDVKMPQKY